jgi:hypothetical protein
MTNRGDTEDPYSPAEIRQKFFDLAVPVWGHPHAEAVIAAVDALPGAADLSALDTLLAAAPITRT